METTSTTVLQAIDTATLAPVVRRSLQRDTVYVLDWHATQLGGGAGNPVSMGLYRLAGSAQDGAERVTWSVILKVIQSPANAGWADMGEGDDQGHWNYWRRELLLYRSGLLDTLPDGLAAPRCLGVVERPGDVAWLWLEDIADSYGGAWPLERYALAARHLGRLNGRYGCSRPLPDSPWLGRSLTGQWTRPTFLWPIPDMDDPRLLAHYPTPAANSFRRMLSELPRFQAKLDLLPRTLCHGDTYPTNFKSRLLANGQEQTVALDWALANIGPLGDDLGQFSFGAQVSLQDAGHPDVDQTLFAAYLDGLRDSGCRVDVQQVRFGFAASAALRVGLFQLVLLRMELQRAPAVAPVAPRWFETTMADEAYRLLEAMD